MLGYPSGWCLEGWSFFLRGWRSANAQGCVSTAHYQRSLNSDPAQDCSSVDLEQGQRFLRAHAPSVLSPPRCQPPPGPRASLASSAFRLDCPFPFSPTSVDQNAEVCPCLPPFVLAVADGLRCETGKWSSGCIVKRTRYSSTLC